MKKLLSSILSAVMLLSAVSFSVSAAETASMLLPVDNLSGTLTPGDTEDLYYVDLPTLNFDYELEVATDTTEDVVLELYNDGDVYYEANNLRGETSITINAEELQPGRYYVKVYTNPAIDQDVLYTLNAAATPSNPKVYTGAAVLWNNYDYTYAKEAYLSFTLTSSSTVNFRFSMPDKAVGAVLYNESGVYDYDYTVGDMTLTKTLPKGTYYVKSVCPTLSSQEEMGVWATKS